MVEVYQSMVSIELDDSEAKVLTPTNGTGGRVLSAREFCYQECRAAVDLVQPAMLTKGKGKDHNRNEMVAKVVRCRWINETIGRTTGASFGTTQIPVWDLRSLGASPHQRRRGDPVVLGVHSVFTLWNLWDKESHDVPKYMGDGRGKRRGERGGEHGL